MDRTAKLQLMIDRMNAAPIGAQITFGGRSWGCQPIAPTTLVKRTETNWGNIHNNSALNTPGQLARDIGGNNFAYYIVIP